MHVDHLEAAGARLGELVRHLGRADDDLAGPADDLVVADGEEGFAAAVIAALELRRRSVQLDGEVGLLDNGGTADGPIVR
nr:hypothetical protein [Jiangella alba]